MPVLTTMNSGPGKVSFCVVVSSKLRARHIAFTERRGSLYRDPAMELRNSGRHSD